MDRDVIVVGDGPGGLSAALFLAKAGKSVVVYGQDNTAMHAALLKNYLGIPEMTGSDFQTIARDQVAAHPDTWGPDAVLFDSADRSEGRPNAIPNDLWSEVLALALRMVAPSSGMVADDEKGTAVFGEVEAEVAGFVRRLRALLFDRQSLNLEIQTVISELSSAHATAED